MPPHEARAYLAKTESGADADAAAAMFWDSAQSTSDDASARRSQTDKSRGRDFDEGSFDGNSEDEERIMRERQRREEEERRRRRRQGPSRDAVKARTRDEIDQQRSGNGTPVGEYGEQAEKILAQASEMGTNFMKSATTFWNSGKERAMKMYEEQKKALEAEQAAKGKKRDVKDGRPRWMVEAEERDREEQMGRDSGREQTGSGSAAGGDFKDSDDDEGPEEPVRRPVIGQSRRTRPEPPIAERKTVEGDLLGADAPKSYQPAKRRPASSRTSAPAPRSAPRQKTPPPLPSRALVEASSSQISSAAAQKQKGNEHFKLGRFSEAAVSYSGAISQLPAGHLFLVPLYNNRAATRLKLGEPSEAAEDCTTVIEIIGPAYHPSKEAPLPANIASEVKLGEALAKATTKRAQAWEMGEKWSKALEDWEKVLGFDAVLMGPTSAATKTLASDGVKRSRQMLQGPAESSSASQRPSAAARKPVRAPPKPTRPANAGPSQAVEELRAAARAAEAEDAQRMAAKDEVDAKVAAWKGGKETNIRALIASLDVVLWDEILSGGLKVGMHELITDVQVKKKYTRVIARLHPDKVSRILRGCGGDSCRSSTRARRQSHRGCWPMLRSAH